MNMKECQNLKEQLDEYLSDRMSDFARRRIDNHLRHCEACAREVAEYQDVIGELRAASGEVAIEPSLKLQMSLERLVNQSEQPQSSFNFFQLIWKDKRAK